MSELTKEQVLALFEYRADLGKFFWRSPKGRSPKGAEAGWLTSHGYRFVTIDKAKVLAHHLVWLVETGSWPTAVLDHKNHNRDDNRFANLRQCTEAQSLQHRRKFKNNKSGFKGVHFDTKAQKWKAKIMAGGKRHDLGFFASAIDAAQAYDAKAIVLHREFAKLNT